MHKYACGFSEQGDDAKHGLDFSHQGDGAECSSAIFFWSGGRAITVYVQDPKERSVAVGSTVQFVCVGVSQVSDNVSMRKM